MKTLLAGPNVSLVKSLLVPSCTTFKIQLSIVLVSVDHSFWVLIVFKSIVMVEILIDWQNQREWFRADEEKSRRYPAKTITDADYADDIAILANTPDQAETLLHSLERAAAGIGLYVNAQKTEYMCYNQAGDISTLDGTPLKLVDKFTYLGSSVASTEKDIETRLAKAWTAINRLSIIWKSDLTDKMKRSFFQAAVTSILLYGCTTWTLKKTAGEEARRQLHKNAASNLEQVLAAIPHKIPTVRPPASYHENYSS